MDATFIFTMLRNNNVYYNQAPFVLLDLIGVLSSPRTRRPVIGTISKSGVSNIWIAVSFCRRHTCSGC